MCHAVETWTDTKHEIAENNPRCATDIGEMFSLGARIVLRVLYLVSTPAFHKYQGLARPIESGFVGPFFVSKRRQSTEASSHGAYRVVVVLLLLSLLLFFFCFA